MFGPRNLREAKHPRDISRHYRAHVADLDPQPVQVSLAPVVKLLIHLRQPKEHSMSLPELNPPRAVTVVGVPSLGIFDEAYVDDPNRLLECQVLMMLAHTWISFLQFSLYKVFGNPQPWLDYPL